MNSRCPFDAMAAGSEDFPKEMLGDDKPHFFESDTAMLLRTMRAHHEQLMQRLDQHERLLRQEMSGPEPRPATRQMWKRWSGRSERADSVRSLESIEADVRNFEGNPGFGISSMAVQVAKRSDSSLSASPRLRSYTAEDKELKQGAELAEASSMRRRYTQKERNIEKNEPRSLGRVGFTPMGKKIVHSPGFDVFFALVVTLNAVYIGLDVQRTLRDGGPRPLEYRLIQYVFTIIFTVELVTRVIVSRCRYFVSDDWVWAFLDLFIVSTSLWDILVDILEAVLPEGSGLGSISGISSIKAFRVIRLTRLLKMVQFLRIFRFVMALRTLVQSILHTLKALFWALLLLVLIVYVFAVLFAQGVNDYITSQPDIDITSNAVLQNGIRYFGGLEVSMLSLFMSIAGGVSWEAVIEPLQLISPVWTLCYIFYICFTYFAVLNVVTAVFCQSAIESAQKDHATVVQNMIDNKESHLRKLRTLFSKLGADADGGITLRMFEEKINSPSVREYFETLGLDIWDTWSFFKLLDANLGGVVDFEEFFMGCLRFSGSASALDLGKLSQDQAWLIRNQGRFQKYMEDEFTKMRGEMSTLSDFISSLSRGVACAQV